MKKNNLCSIIFINVFICIVLILMFLSPGCEKPVKGDMGSQSPEPSPADLQALYRKAKDREKSFNYPEAEALFEQIIKSAPENDVLIPKSRMHLGKIFYFTGKYEPAIREFKMILESKHVNQAAAKAYLAMSYLASDRPDMAVGYIGPDIDEFSRWGTHYSLLSQSRYAQYELEEDMKYLEILKSELDMGIEKSENDFQKSMLSACRALFDSDYGMTGEYFRKALTYAEETRDRVSLNFLLGALEARGGKRDNSMPYFRKALVEADAVQSLEISMFLDFFYSYWAHCHFSGKPMQIHILNELTDKIPGGYVEPEFEKFIDNLRKYIDSRSNGKQEGALEYLDNIEHAVNDESIEGDYIYEAVCKPFILGIIYSERLEIMNRLGVEDLQDEYSNRAKSIMNKKFPPDLKDEN